MQAINVTSALVVMLGWMGFQSLAQSPDELFVRIKADRVNLRAKPDPAGEVVTQAALDERLRVLETQEAWIRVAPPERVELWVHRDFVKDGLSTGEKVNIRAGAGIHFSVVGQYTRGERVEVRGEFGDWLKVAPSNASLWVSREWTELLYAAPIVEPVPAPLAQGDAAAAEAAAAVASPIAPSEPAPGPLTDVPAAPESIRMPPPAPQPMLEAGAQPPRDLKLVPLEGQGRLVEREGELKPAPFVFGRPSKFRLARREGNQLKTVCYVRGNTGQLNSLMNESLIISGREYWVQGIRQPVLVPERIERPAR